MVSAQSAAARADRAHQAAAALKELDQAFTAVIAKYMERVATLAAEEPWEARKISNLALAARIAREVRAEIQVIAADEAPAMAELNHLRNIERMSPERRKVLGISLPA